MKKLNAISDGIWHAESSLKWYFLNFGIRMVVVRLPDGGIWLHSPIQIDEELYKEIKSLGEVSHIVAPSCFHHTYARDETGNVRCRGGESPGLPAADREIPSIAG